jgi:tetratricopeptide (TPR) repeat protein
MLAVLGRPDGQASGASAAVQQAVEALQRQDYQSAETKLRAELKLHPADPETLSLLGVALDGERKFSEAGQFHRKALAAAPRLPAVLNNYANNLLATGDEKGAREMLLRSVALDPADHNANILLVQMALNRKDGKEALLYLDHLKDAPDAAVLRLIALDLTGDRAQATAIFEKLAEGTRNDGRLSAENGQALARAGQFEQAETFLTHALAMNPSDFGLLYSLGVTASRAGDLPRAREVLEAARRQQPGNVDALYALAFVYSSMAQPEAAIRLLAEAARIAPQRADVQKLLATAAGDLGAHDDSVAAWGRYLQLMPGDDTARRELAFEKAKLGLLDEALPELRRYTEKHPDDATGFYEMGVSEGANDPAAAIAWLDKALALKPDYVVAHATRGELLYGQNQREAALPDLEFAASHFPGETPELASVLDRLGQTYMALNRVADAVPILRKAAALAPDDPKTQLHLANALAESGKTEESEALMARFRQMKPGARARAVNGVVDYLSMSPEERHELYRTRLETTVKDHPDDTAAQLLYMKFLLAENQLPEATAAAVRFTGLKPGAPELADAGHAMLEAGQYTQATQLLQAAARGDASAVNVRLDLAMAVFRAAGSGAAAAEDGLRQLDAIPNAARNSGYYLARAQMLDAAGDPAAAVYAATQAVRAAPEDPDIYWRTVALMTRNRQTDDALELLDQAAKALPQEAQIPVIRAAIMELAGKSDDAQRLLKEVQHRWPEMAAGWVAQGMVLAANQQFDDARSALETAVALGAHSPETWLALAVCSLRSKPERADSANAALTQARKISPDDSQIMDLAALVAARKGTAPLAIDVAVDPAKLFLNRPPRDW